MKKISLLFLVSISILSGNAQTNVIDSLKQLLQKEKQDTSRVLLLNQLAFYYFQSKPDTTLLLAQEGLLLARKAGFEKGEAESLNRIGDAYGSLSNYPKSLDYLLQGLKINENIKYQRGILMSLMSIARNYSLLDDYRKALDYSFKAKEIVEKNKDEKNYTAVLYNIGDFYTQLLPPKLDSAGHFVELAYEIAKRNNDISHIGGPSLLLGHIHRQLKEYPLALEYYRLSIPYFNLVEDDEHLIGTYIGLAQVFEQTGKIDSCLFYSKQAFENIQKTGLTYLMPDASKLLYTTYKSKNQLDSAFKYLEIAFNANDSLFSQDKTNKLQNLTFTEELRQEKIELEKRKDEDHRKHNIEYAGIAIGLIIFLSLFLLLSHSIIVNAKWIKFIGILGLLLVFEFINILIGPYLARLTNNSTVLILLVLVGIAAILVPIHNKLEKWVIEKLVQKNKKIRLASAKKTIEQLGEKTDSI